MSEDRFIQARRTAACIAFRHIADVNESEREDVLLALMDCLPSHEAELAERMLYHMREEKRLQRQLWDIVSAKREAAA